MPTKLYDGSGRPVVLGREIARGGEGAVLDVAHAADLVAKVYHGPVDPEKVDKLRAMARLGTPALSGVAAWPLDTLHASPDGELAGILLPRVAGHHEVHQLYSPAQRRVHFPKADWQFLLHVAMNCAAAFETVHHAGHVIGDVNQSGLLVSERGTIRLIDCDSFQIRDGGRVYGCVVGVPQYTPPELQGLSSFRGVQRTAAHDCFGLALVVFHLLFMGRHPFAGRYQGPGDMPIERAIAEGRFAFGRTAGTVQMLPPPHSLALGALPAQVAAMFERAFARPAGPVAARPSASEWRHVLATLKAGLNKCPNDSGHRFPSGLSACPWCDIMRAGGPNFFVSVTVVAAGVAVLELPPFDAAALWARIEAVPAPPTHRPRAAAPHVTPTPLPEEVREQGTFLRIVVVAFVVGIVALAVGALVGMFLVYLGAALTGIFGCWAAVLAFRSKLSRELARRRDAAQAARRELSRVEGAWDGVARTYAQRFDAAKRELAEARDEGLQLRGRFDKERRAVEARKQELQLKAHLERYFIRDHRIPNIGKGRVATLLSFDIETAADVDERYLRDVPGFGPVMIQHLVDWRDGIARNFRPDPGHVPPAARALQQTYMRFKQAQQSFEMKLSDGPRQLAEITTRAAHELASLEAQLHRLTAAVAQAEADMRAA